MGLVRRMRRVTSFRAHQTNEMLVSMAKTERGTVNETSDGFLRQTTAFRSESIDDRSGQSRLLPITRRGFLACLAGAYSATAWAGGVEQQVPHSVGSAPPIKCLNG